MKHIKTRYQVQNWPQYEEELRNLGPLTVWRGMVNETLDHWGEPKRPRRKLGRPRRYSQHAIETAVTLGVVFGLASRH